MRKIRVLLPLTISLLASTFVFSQSPCPACKTFTISNASDFNVTASSPFRPVDGNMNANLNISSLINELASGNVIIDEGAFFSYEMVIVEDVHYSSGSNLTFSSFNSLLAYADIKNDSTGGIELFGQSHVVIGTGVDWVGIRGLGMFGPICCITPALRPVEVGSRRGSTFVNAGINIFVVAPPGIPGSHSRLGCSNPTLTASINMIAGNHILINGGGDVSYAQVGFGADTTASGIHCPITLTCEEGNVWLYGSESDAYAQVGHRNNGTNAAEGMILANVNSVQVNLPQFGNMRLEGGPGFNASATVGHRHGGVADGGRTSGRINLNLAGSLSCFAGSGPSTHARIGHYTTGTHLISSGGPIGIYAGQNVTLDAHAFTGIFESRAGIGHELMNLTGVCIDSIYIECGVDSGGLFLQGGDDSGQEALIGHSARAGTNTLGGAIDISAHFNVKLNSGTGMNARAQIGHYEPGALLSNLEGDIRIRSGDSIVLNGSDINHTSAPARIGHYGNSYSGKVIGLTPTHIVLQAGSSGADSSSAAEIEATDTIDLTAGSHIWLLGASAEARIQMSGTGSTFIRTGGNFLARSNGWASGALHNGVGDRITVEAAGDIEWHQPRLEMNDSTGGLLLHADRPWADMELWNIQLNRDSLPGPFMATLLELNSPPIPLDSAGAVIFNHPDSASKIRTQFGDIHIFNAPYRTDGTDSELRISSLLSHSLDWQAMGGNLYIDMFRDLNNDLVDRNHSNWDAFIDQWTAVFDGSLWLNVRDEIDVEESKIDMKNALLLTNTGIP